jgi:hypothetical protein
VEGDLPHWILSHKSDSLPVVRGFFLFEKNYSNQKYGARGLRNKKF